MAQRSPSFRKCFSDDEGSAVWQRVAHNAVPAGRRVVTVLQEEMPMPVQEALQLVEQRGESSGESRPLSIVEVGSSQVPGSMSTSNAATADAVMHDAHDDVE
ncbi:hypothetical protein BCR44DRAFT_327098 [Catenaria anguillulae PL171]|uniref:Uncharacterized protein n=1 Tax=Catenaria anguillulae PL171 TaxID=765915 RepID=A0A1Y2HB73_9FUNG|nr:hypothetical protein BCR44DRAFT_327098 [Catenaria anguillulae PL171]